MYTYVLDALCGQCEKLKQFLYFLGEMVKNKHVTSLLFYLCYAI